MRITLGLKLVMLSFLFSFISCKKETSPAQSSNPKNTSHPIISARIGDGKLGDIHNELMEYANNNQDSLDDSTFTLLTNSIELMFGNYLTTNYPEYYDSTLLSLTKTYCNPAVLFTALDGVEDDWDMLVENNKMDSTEREFLVRLKEVCIENKNGFIDNEGFYNKLLEIKAEVDSTSSNFEFVNGVLDIGIGSCEYWFNYWETVETSGVAPFVANDAAGALVGGTVAAVTEYASTGDVSLGSIGRGALVGAVSASVKFVSTVAKGIARFFGW